MCTPHVLCTYVTLYIVVNKYLNQVATNHTQSISEVGGTNIYPLTLVCVQTTIRATVQEGCIYTGPRN